MSDASNVVNYVPSQTTTPAKLHKHLLLTGPACDKTNEHAPSHGHEPVERHQGTEVSLSRMNLRLPPRGALGLTNNRSNNFPGNALRQTPRNYTTYERTGQTL